MNQPTNQSTNKTKQLREVLVSQPVHREPPLPKREFVLPDATAPLAPVFVEHAVRAAIAPAAQITVAPLSSLLMLPKPRSMLMSMSPPRLRPWKVSKAPTRHTT